MNWREHFGLLFLLGIAIAAAVGGVHFLSQAIDHLTGRP